MTTPNAELAKRAREIAKSSEGLKRIAANCSLVALSYSPSVDVARDALGELERLDVKRAALEMIDQLMASEASRTA
jgi:hypothetical protein